MTKTTSDKTIDYIVIGAGSAGCVLANRLSSPKGGSVLLLEAGGGSRSLLYRMPLAATKLWFNPKTSWSFFSQPEPGLKGRSIPVSRGKALGGSSAINGTVYNRGSSADYNRWSEMGLKGWDYASLLPYFKRIENHWRGADEFHGGEGEVPITPVRYRSPFTAPFIEAVKQQGLAVSDDQVGAETEGVGLSDLNVSASGRRMSAYDAFIHPIRKRASLTIETRAQVLRILFENQKAIGVEYVQNGKKYKAFANREVILSGGAINSPQLLKLSGIGPADELKKHGIEIVRDLPEVGENLTDQPGGGFEFLVNQPYSFIRNLRMDRFAVSLLQWFCGFGGFVSGPPMVAVGAVRTNKDCKQPDMRLTLTAATMDSKAWFPGIIKPGVHKLMLSFAVAHPKSRGSITLASSDPLAHPKIQYNLLTENSDIEQLKSHYKLLNELICQPAFAGIVGKFVRPAVELKTDKELEDYLRQGCGTTSHPMGSCRMGVDENSVVDEQCRVRGIEKLRVTDASVFPTQISGNPHSTVMMLGERVSNFILS
jgi:choline dehydrogenase